MSSLTPEVKQKVIEYQKCKTDMFHFAELYVKLAQSGTFVIPILYEPQKKFLRSLLTNHYEVLLKTRQTGGSTASQIYCAWAMVFHKNIVVGIISRKGSEATDFAKKVMRIIEALPDWMRPDFVKQSEQQFALDNGSELYAESISASNPQGVFRGKSITIAVIDEAAHTQYLDDAYTSFAPALFKAHKVAEQQGVPYGLMIISTPNRTMGIGKWFFEMWDEAKQEDSLFKANTLYWKDIPDFADDPKWYVTQCKLLKNDQGRIKQELEMEFLGSTDSWLPLTTIDQLNKCHCSPMSVMNFQGGELWQWKPLNMQEFYLLGVDTASASGADKSTIEIFDMMAFEQCAEFSGKLEVFEFCKVLHTINKIYPNNLMIIENNSYGNQVVETLRHSKDSFNLFVQKEEHKKQNAQQKSSRAVFSSKTTKRPLVTGLSTNARTRPLMMDALYSAVVDNPNMIKSERLVHELIALVEVNTARTVRVEADSGFHDDLVMALAFLSYVRKFDPPMGFETIATAELADDIMETIIYNDDVVNFQKSASVGTINNYSQFTQHKTVDNLNAHLRRHVKDNLHEMGQAGQAGKIDTFSIMGINRTGKKSNI